MKLTVFSISLYFFASTIIFYTFFKVIEIMKKKYSYNYTFTDRKNLNTEEILLGVTSVENNHDYKIIGFGKKNTQNNFSLPLDLIIEGKIIYKNLKAIKKDSVWLTQVLKKKGIKDIEEVTYGVLDSSGEIILTLN